MPILEIQVITSAFLLIFIGEVGDKTQLVTLSLASSKKSPILIFLATSLALTVSAVAASLLGGLAATALPDITSYISSFLFLAAGVYILTVKEPPQIKRNFLNLVLLERWLASEIEHVFKKHNAYSFEIMNITRQEQSHHDVFRRLIKLKTLFDDDLGDDTDFTEIAENLSFSTKIRKLPFQEAVEGILKRERSSVKFYAYLRNHLDEDHHDDISLQQMLDQIILEEEEHIRILENAIGKGGEA